MNTEVIDSLSSYILLTFHCSTAQLHHIPRLIDYILLLVSLLSACIVISRFS